VSPVLPRRAPSPPSLAVATSRPGAASRSWVVVAIWAVVLLVTGLATGAAVVFAMPDATFPAAVGAPLPPTDLGGRPTR
jgi:hypothetical protein